MENNKNNFSLLKRVIALAKPYNHILFIAAILAIVLAPVAIVRPYLIQIMVDEYIFQSNLTGLTFMAFVVLAALIVEVILQYLFLYFTNLLGQSVIKDLRVSVFQHITNLRLSYFDKTPIGTSTTRTINDIESINTVFSQGAITIVADMLTIVAVLGIMLYTSWKLTLVCLTTLPFLLLAAYLFKEGVRKSYQTVRTQISKMNAFLQERITGMKVVQIFHVEAQEMENFKTINREYTKANLDAILYYALFYPAVEIIQAASLALMVWWGAGEAIKDQISFGTLIAFPLYLSMLFRPIRMLADRFNTLQMGLVASERVFKLLDRDEFIENTGRLKPERLKGKVEFKQVWFAYNQEEYVLKDVSFQILPGKTLAIVGSTGSGKTTVINLLNRFYEINKGQILIDDLDMKDYELLAYRSRIAVVLQDVFLFSGSVFENITLRNEAITREKVMEASKLIGAHPFIEQLPGGYEYQVMERGLTLSMGQRQLISFVRALVFNPDILILDEATSSIDPETESVIQHAIETLISKRTSIIIAHRLTTIKHADHILVMDQGEVKEFGSHETLLKLEDGHYRKLYDMQFLQMAGSSET